MTECFSLLCVVLRDTRSWGGPREPRPCGTSCCASQPQCGLQKSPLSPGETLCSEQKCLFLQQAERVSSRKPLCLHLPCTNPQGRGKESKSSSSAVKFKVVKTLTRPLIPKAVP